MNALHGRTLLAASAALAFVVAACTPVVLPSEGPATTTTTTSTTTTTAPPVILCPSLEIPDPSPPPGEAIEYEAIVEHPGDPTGEVVTFEARSNSERNRKIDQLERGAAEVTAVGPVVPVQALEVNPTNDPRYTNPTSPSGQPQQIPLRLAGFADVNDTWVNYDGTGVIVAVLDTGVQGNHPDFNDAIPAGPTTKVLPGMDFIVPENPNGGAVDPSSISHGTHVAGIAGAVDNMVGGLGGAPGVQILPVRVLDCNGSGSSTVIANAIDWAVANGADVINLSLGGASESSVMHDKIQDAVEAGVVVVAAAGNCGVANGTGSDGCQSTNNIPLYPGAFDEVIAVGALKSSWTGAGSQNPTEKATFSNNNTYVDVAAPGSFIDSTLNTLSYGSKNGTSMSTPFVSAVVALLLQKCAATLPAQALAKFQDFSSLFASGFADDPNVRVLDAFAVLTNTPAC